MCIRAVILSYREDNHSTNFTCKHKLTYQNENATNVDTKVYTNGSTNWQNALEGSKIRQNSYLNVQAPVSSSQRHRAMSLELIGGAHIIDLCVQYGVPVFQGASGSISCSWQSIERQIKCRFHTVTTEMPIPCKVGFFSVKLCNICGKTRIRTMLSRVPSPIGF